MPTRPRRPAMYNTPAIRTGGFGALQVEAITNRPLSIARRHLAASQLRMRDIEPDELSSSEWVRFLVMEERERDRWMANFTRRRRDSDSSTASSSSSSSPSSPSSSTAAAESGSGSGSAADDKAEEAAREQREEAEEEEAERRRQHRRHQRRSRAVMSQAGAAAARVVGTTPAVSLWVRQFDGGSDVDGTRRPLHVRRDIHALVEAPPTYESAVRLGAPPPPYEPRR